ncbi:DNA-binding protein [Eubacteriales bacterium OttesenSCG-928-K08]|nr:DNA-binding protein [Eubacteriales bacterium OttesenSCG-928-K08]
MQVEGFIQDGGKFLFGRLSPGTEFLSGIDALCEKFNVQCGSLVGCLGSLSRAVYTYIYPAPDQAVGIKYYEPFILETPAELISAQGTIGPNKGKRDIHLHCVMCDMNGNFIAGHMLPGCIVCATMELSILVAPENSIERSFDDESQFSIFRYNTLTNIKEEKL